jgi:hypothetical protein
MAGSLELRRTTCGSINDGVAVGEIEAGGERIGGGVGGSEHAVFDGGTGEGGAEQHAAAGFEIRGTVEDGTDGGGDEAEGSGRICGGDRVALGADGGLERVREGVEGGEGGDRLRGWETVSSGSRMAMRARALGSPQAIFSWEPSRETTA